MKPTTGTHVYTLLKCRRAVALELVGDRDQKRPHRPEEEFTLQRGRDHEARIVAELGWPEPEFERGDWVAAATATEEFLLDGVPGVSQGVLVGEDRLGIPDLLRREPGESKFGDYHYVVGDIKSSAVSRSDQVLQVAFYSRMLTKLQERAPEYGYLILKDGREERFALDDYDPALRQVEREIAAIREDPNSVRPFYGMACSGCQWSEVCLPSLEAEDDLSLLPGMTRALRRTLEGAGMAKCEALVDVRPEVVGESARLEPALVRRLQRAAVARRERRPVLESRAAATDLEDAAIVHMLMDSFLERVLWFGVVYPATEAAVIHDALPPSQQDEWDAFAGLVRQLPRSARLLHYGSALPHWFEDQAHGRSDSMSVETRFVDLGRRLRGAAILQGPAFGLADHVRLVLGVDPFHSGRGEEAALRASNGELEWLRAKGRADLNDLVRLRTTLLGTPISGDA